MQNHQNLLAAAQIILEGFATYRKSFNATSQRARERFENRDWKGIQADSRERLTLYKKIVNGLALKVRGVLQEEYDKPENWQSLKQTYSHEVAPMLDTEIAETFFNSVCRKVIGGMGADKAMMFVEGEIMRLDFQAPSFLYRTYSLDQTPEKLMEQILSDYAFEAGFEDRNRDVKYLTDRLVSERLHHRQAQKGDRIELLKSVFFRNKAAYVVGRLHQGGEVRPFVIPFLHQEGGVFADTLILDTDTMSILFSFSRSYFLVVVSIPSEVVRFLRSTMLGKSSSEIYNSLGFHKHGKTELYREIIRYLPQNEEQFIRAPGIKGMVMSVFTLPRFHIVFKLIRDRFDPPKVTNKPKVRLKYRLVKHHDRIGRMADTHEFEHFVFPKKYFSDELLQELMEVAPSIVKITGEQVEIEHLYTERKMIPLNIFMGTATPDELEEVIDEYGNTIKQLAAVNIFPGDMLLKNFGVTRHRRVVFYDYDEIGFLTEYNFREMPKPPDDDPYNSGGIWLEVNEGDVFPEEFRHFLIGHKAMKEKFVALHSDLFTVEFWRKMQELQRRGEILDVFPYRRKIRFQDRR